MIKVILESNNEFKQLTTNVENSSVILNNSEHFIDVVIPQYNKNPYPISPRGLLWLSEAFSGEALGKINSIHKEIPKGTSVEVQLLTIEEYKGRFENDA